MAQELRRRRYDNGPEFDRAEVRFEIDKDGHPIDVYFKESKEANKLIEEFSAMLANLTVAEFIGKAKERQEGQDIRLPCTHNPDPEKLANFSLIAMRFGYKVNAEGRAKEVNKSLNRTLKNVKGKGEENMLPFSPSAVWPRPRIPRRTSGTMALRSTITRISPRPYAAIPIRWCAPPPQRYFDKGRSADKTKIEDLCQHSSEMEQLAANAERASIRYKQVEYTADKLGKVYQGVISGVTEWGFYVELNENKCEGLVPVRDLADDYYDLDEKNYCLIGRRHGNKYMLGDEVKVQVARADLDRKQLDLRLWKTTATPTSRCRRVRQRTRTTDATSRSRGQEEAEDPHPRRQQTPQILKG